MWKETGPVKNNVGKRETAEYKHLLFHIFFQLIDLNPVILEIISPNACNVMKFKVYHSLEKKNVKVTGEVCKFWRWKK